MKLELSGQCVIMPILAVYLPDESELIRVIPPLVLAFLVLCGAAHRMKLSVPLAAFLMILGCLIALAPGLHAAMNSDLGDYGTLARKVTNSTLSDGALSMIMYMNVGYGSLIAFSGMIIPLALYFLVNQIGAKRNAPEVPIDQSVKK